MFLSLFKNAIVSILLLASPTTAIAVKSEPIQDVSHVMVEVNGHRRVLRAGNTLVLVRGDRLKLIDAGLSTVGQRIERMNVVNSQLPLTPPWYDETGMTIQTTSSRFAEKLSHNPTQPQFRIQVGNRQKLLGTIPVLLVEPQLRYAEVRINGSTRISRPGTLLRLNAQDQFRIADVRTNVPDQDNEVAFQIVPLASHAALSSIKFYEIQFHRRGEIFARIPVQIEEL